MELPVIPDSFYANTKDGWEGFLELMKIMGMNVKIISHPVFFGQKDEHVKNMKQLVRQPHAIHNSILVMPQTSLKQEIFLMSAICDDFNEDGP